MARFLVVAGFAESLVGFRLPLIKSLLAAGQDVHVAAPDTDHNGGAVRLKLEELGVVVHNYPLSRTGLNPLSDFFSLVALVVLIWRVRPLYFLGYTVKPVIYGTIAAWIARTRHRFVLVTGLGHNFQEDDMSVGAFENFLGWLYRFALSHAHKVIFQNPDDAALFRRRAILSKNTPSVVVNGSGVDVAEFAHQPTSQQVPIFLLISRLLNSKGVRIYAAAARRIKKHNPQVRFLLAGWIDEGRDSISSLELEEWQREGSLEYLGKLNDVREALAACTVFVLPTFYREGTPRSVLEALSVGRAIITTDMPGCRETVEHGQNGFLIEPKSVWSLEEAMQAFIADLSIAGRMGWESRRIAVERYDVDLINETMLEEMGIASMVPKRRT